MAHVDTDPASDEGSASLREVALQATTAWGLRPKSISLIKQRENAVYKLQTEDDELFALRVHRAGYHTDAALSSEFAWMKALQEVGIKVPTFLLSLSNDVVVTTSHANLDAPRQVDILLWIDGEQLGSVEEGLGDSREEISKIYSVIGRTMAQLHIHSSTWSPPVGFIRHAWDAAGLVGEDPFWGRFWELTLLSPEQRELIITARVTVAQKLAQLPKTRGHFGMIHADLVPGGTCLTLRRRCILYRTIQIMAWPKLRCSMLTKRFANCPKKNSITCHCFCLREVSLTWVGFTRGRGP